MCREIEHGLFKADQEAGFLQSRDDCHEGSKHHNRGIRETAEGCLDVRDAEHHHEEQGDERRRAERQLVDHDQDDHKNGNCQRKYHRCCHTEILLRTFRSFVPSIPIYR